MCINEFFIAIMLTANRLRPATVEILSYLPTDVRGTMYGEAAVAGLLIMALPVVFFVLVQRHFISGLLQGSIK